MLSKMPTNKLFAVRTKAVSVLVPPTPKVPMELVSKVVILVIPEPVPRKTGNLFWRQSLGVVALAAAILARVLTPSKVTEVPMTVFARSSMTNFVAPPAEAVTAAF